VRLHEVSAALSLRWLLGVRRGRRTPSSRNLAPDMELEDTQYPQRHMAVLRADLRPRHIAVLRSTSASLVLASSFSLVSGLTGVIFLVAMVMVSSRSVVPGDPIVDRVRGAVCRQADTWG